MAKVYIAQGRVREGEDLLLHARPILERAYGPESPKVAALLNHLGLANDMLDRAPQAVGPVSPVHCHLREARKLRSGR